LWKIEKETLEFVSDWVKVAAFQKQKPFATHNKVLSPEAGKNKYKPFRSLTVYTLKQMGPWTDYQAVLVANVFI